MLRSIASQVCALGFAIAAGVVQAAPLVAIDVGHSLKRPGVIAASGAGEFELNRMLAKAVVERLRARNVATLVIGDDGKADVLTQRTAAARNASLFVSLHHDSVQPQFLDQVAQFSGFAVLVSRKNVAPDMSLACAQQVAQSMIAVGRRPSRYHAAQIQGENRPFADEQRGVHWFDDLVVLRTAIQPALLIESAVVVNAADERRVTSPEGRAKLADGIAGGIVACLGGGGVR
ncbi:MAG: N-acetylmuramoyl-L-alanine amidase [Cupriavidus sp.]|nr:MAG: N-acetylmuramoyl-L-alanine amidase [Cupriavidus sp.]